MEQEKKCTRCNIVKNINQFSFKNVLKGTKLAHCKICNKIYGKIHYEKNKSLYKTKAVLNNKNYKLRNKFFCEELKTNKPCKDCNVIYPHYVLDFDHLPEFDKKNDIAYMKNKAYSLESIELELKKCELVCANCHRIRTWKRKNNNQ